jgi:hypothetical protein
MKTKKKAIKKAEAKAVKKAVEKAPGTRAKAPEVAPGAERITKKSVVIDILNSGGGTLDEMAKKITADKLGGDEKFNRKIAALWLRKLPFKVKRQEDGVYKKV